MEGVFEEIKDRLSMPEVVRFYGFETNHAGMMCCPFHDDHNPSMENYKSRFSEQRDKTVKSEDKKKSA